MTDLVGKCIDIITCIYLFAPHAVSRNTVLVVNLLLQYKDTLIHGHYIWMLQVMGTYVELFHDYRLRSRYCRKVVLDPIIGSG